MRAIFILVTILIVTPSIMDAQVIFGRLRDAVTKEPIEGVHVFISGTETGVISDENGFYRFYTNGRKYFRLVFSHVSYEIEAYDFENLSENIKLDKQLLGKMNMLEAVEVTATRNRRRERRLKEFKDFFFGDYHDEDKIKIENEYVIDFKRTSGGGFEVEGNPVLKVLNNHLNYEIYFHLLDYNDRNRYFFGYSDFTDLNSLNDIDNTEFEENRKKAYWGSLRHFFYALIHDKLGEEGFSTTLLESVKIAGNSTLLKQNSFNPTPLRVKDMHGFSSNIQLKKLESGLYELYIEHMVKITYLDELDAEGLPQVSTLTLKKPILINSNGVVANPDGMGVEGYLINEGVYHFLPFEFSHVSR